jgi:hypothetical protein
MSGRAEALIMTRHELAIAKTVIYASLFDYPLSLRQVHDTLIGVTLTAEQILTVYDNSPQLKKIVCHREGFFFPFGRDELIAERLRREYRSRKFLKRYRPLLRLLCTVPFTRMIALSGSVAHLNLEAGGDLDVFIITRGRTVWMVTVAVLLLTRVLGVRRTICANLIMSDERLAVDQQDLFTANQVVHLKPVLDDHVLDGFRAANPFVQRYYPNWRGPSEETFIVPLGTVLPRMKRASEMVLAWAVPFLESLCRYSYARHLRRRSRTWRSPDQVQLRPDYLKLHSSSHRRSVLDRFEERVEEVVGHSERAAIA